MANICYNLSMMNKDAELNLEKLNALIEKSGFKTSHIANRVGLEVGTLRLIISGRRKTSRPVIKLLAQVLHVEEKELLKAS
jgi:transcriptional regulator with XRE-family HTH domain